MEAMGWMGGWVGGCTGDWFCVCALLLFALTFTHGLVAGGGGGCSIGQADVKADVLVRFAFQYDQ